MRCEQGRTKVQQGALREAAKQIFFKAVPLGREIGGKCPAMFRKKSQFLRGQNYQLWSSYFLVIFSVAVEPYHA